MGKDLRVASCYEGSKFVLIGSNSEIYCLNEMSLEMQVGGEFWREKLKGELGAEFVGEGKN